MELTNDLFLRAARGEQVERVPVWMMRQAGRILAEYRAVRQKAGSFIQLATTPELAAEVTIQPVDILGVDAAIIFSDILVIPEAMGLPYEMVEAKGPIFPQVIRSQSDIDKLHFAEPESHLKYVLDAIDIVKRDLNNRVPLIGFAGAPFTIFCYMVEGHGSKTFSVAKKCCIQTQSWHINCCKKLQIQRLHISKHKQLMVPTLSNYLILGQVFYHLHNTIPFLSPILLKFVMQFKKYP
jgi:uroporphyrinogen decarboxylase